MAENDKIIGLAILGFGIFGVLKSLNGVRDDIEAGNDFVTIDNGNVLDFFGDAFSTPVERLSSDNSNNRVDPFGGIFDLFRDNSRGKGEKMSTVTLDELYSIKGKKYGLDPLLLKAIAIVESNENPNAVNPTDPSTGLMQVLCRADTPNSSCKNNFNIRGWSEATPNRLFDPDFNLEMASQILKWNLETYGFKKGIAVYNSWSARFSEDNGPFPNQGYVSKVLREYASLGGSV